MIRTFLISFGVVVMGFMPLALAQDDAWRGLLTEGITVAGQKEYGKAEQLLQQALKESEKFGSEDSRVGTTLNTLGLVYRAEKKFAEAEASYRKAANILQKSYGPESIDVANVNFNIAAAMVDQGQAQGALPYLQRTLVIYEKVLGSSSLKTAAALCLIGDAHRLAKEFDAAESSLRRCADIRESQQGMQSSDLAEAQHSLALTLTAEGKFALAEPRFKLAEKIREGTLGITSPVLAQTFEDHANLLRKMGKEREADRLAGMAAAIRRSERSATSLGDSGKSGSAADRKK